MKTNEHGKQPRTRRAADRDYVEALDYLAELSADEAEYYTSELDNHDFRAQRKSK